MNFDDLVEEMDAEVECSQPLSSHGDCIEDKYFAFFNNFFYR